MSTSDVVLPGFYLRLLIQLVEQEGGNVNTLLTALGFEKNAFEAEQITLSWQRYKALILKANELVDNRHQNYTPLGYIMGERLILSTHGILGYAAMSATTVRDVIGLLQRFLPLRTELLSIHPYSEGDEYRVMFRANRDLESLQRTTFETIVLAAKNVLDFVTMGHAGIRYVAFSCAPGSEKQTQIAQRYLRCEVRYQHDWAGIALSRDVLDTPLTMANSASFDEALKICETELAKLKQRHLLSNQVRQLMLKSYCHFPTLTHTAQSFHLTPRTLHRRLLEEGTSYKALLEEVRHTLAVQYLQGGQMRMQEVAYALGYSDIANFRRAFKRWEGVAPSEYQK